MSPMTTAADAAGLTLLILAIVVANARRPAWWPARRRPALRLVDRDPDQAARQRDSHTAGQRTRTAAADRGYRANRARTAAGRPHSRPALVLVENRVSGPAALQLEEPIGPGDEQHAVPQPRGVLAARDR